MRKKGMEYYSTIHEQWATGKEDDKLVLLAASTSPARTRTFYLFPVRLQILWAQPQKFCL